MHSDQQRETVTFNSDEVMVFGRAYDYVRHNTNAENLPDCLASRELELPTAKEDGTVIVDGQLVRVAQNTFILAVGFATRNLSRLIKEYLDLLDSDSQDDNALAVTLEPEIIATKGLIDQFTIINEQLLVSETA